MTSPWHVLGDRPTRFLLSSAPWRGLGYLLVSALMLPVFIGLVMPTLLLLPLWGILIGIIERRRTRWMGFARQQSPHVVVPRSARHKWLSIRLGEPATWREVGVVLLNALLSLVAYALLIAEAFALVVVGSIAVHSIIRPGETITITGDFTLTGRAWPNLLLCAVALVVTLVAAAYLNVLFATAQAALLRPLCAPRDAELAIRVADLTRSRAAIIDAADAERRRIERDLHDGVQHELVALGMRMGLLELQLEDEGTPPAQVRETVAAMRESTDHALESLRRTVRGLHPVVLDDRGLEAALAELTSRSPLRLTLDVDIPRLAPAVETAAYFTVTEALTNAAKHSTASAMQVHARVLEGTLTVTATADGGGTIDESRGTGLAGLRERATALGGSMDITTGKCTALTLRLPAHERQDAHAHSAR